MTAAVAAVAVAAVVADRVSDSNLGIDHRCLLKYRRQNEIIDADMYSVEFFILCH